MDSSRMCTARCSCRLGGGGSAKGVCQPGGCTPPWTQRPTPPPGPRGRHPPPPVNRQLQHRQLLKHCLSATTVADGKNCQLCQQVKQLNYG